MESRVGAHYFPIQRRRAWEKDRDDTSGKSSGRLGKHMLGSSKELVLKIFVAMVCASNSSSSDIYRPSGHLVIKAYCVSIQSSSFMELWTVMAVII